MPRRMEVRVHDPESLDGSLLLIGFPSRGLVGGVAATYVIDDLKMKHIASIYDPRLPPTMVVRQGVGHSPIQFYASAETCGPDGSCDKLIICQSEIPLEQKILGDVAWTILQWAKDEGVRHVVVLEGIDPTRPGPRKNGQKDAAATIRGVRSLTSKHDLKRYHVEPWDEGLLSGYASAFLMAADDLGVDLVALFVEASADLPDARAAATLLRSVDAMLPHIDFRTKELDERALQVEQRMKTTLERNKRHLEEMRRTLEMMYR
jgi:predicted ATP-grasp superfamily ATP-dependent carboligase